MKCPRCHHPDSKVTDSRDVNDWTMIRRRRECLSCGFRFTTYEKIWFTELMVIKKNGSKELYNRDKLRRSVALAFTKRNSINIEIINELLDKLERTRIEAGNEINSYTIGEDVLKELKDIDFVAYIRFMSVYKQFTSIDDFKNFIS